MAFIFHNNSGDCGDSYCMIVLNDSNINGDIPVMGEVFPQDEGYTPNVVSEGELWSAWV